MKYGVLRGSKPSVAFVRSGVCKTSGTAQGRWYFYSHDFRETGRIYAVNMCLDALNCREHGPNARLLQDKELFEPAKENMIAFDPLKKK